MLYLEQLDQSSDLMQRDRVIELITNESNAQQTHFSASFQGLHLIANVEDNRLNPTLDLQQVGQFPKSWP